jgi:hypothetical protein
VMRAVLPGKLQIETTPVPLADVEGTWNEDIGRSRVVFVVADAENHRSVDGGGPLRMEGGGGGNGGQGVPRPEGHGVK